MNIFSIVAKPMAIIIIVSALATSYLHAHMDSDAKYTYGSNSPSYSVDDIKDRLNNISSIIDINYTPEVGRRIKEYTVNYRVAGERILGRVNLFFPIFEKELNNRNLPEDLMYVAVVESNLEPSAMSKSGAAGLWQFIKSTGKMQGLVINNYIDERKDPEKSTKAALDYLSYLHDSFGDWTLAMAAYNCGPGNVRKAIRRGGSKDYWKIRKHLPNETQKYVPRIIAAMYLMKYYHAHELSPSVLHEDIRSTIKITDGKGHSFQKLAERLDVDYKTLRYLNPMYKTKSFPKNSGNLSLIIPASRKNIYLANYDPNAYAIIRKQKELKERKKQELLEAQAIQLAKILPIDRVETLVYDRLLSQEWQGKLNVSM